jgi:hypothetical protein
MKKFMFILLLSLFVSGCGKISLYTSSETCSFSYSINNGPMNYVSCKRVRKGHRKIVYWDYNLNTNVINGNITYFQYGCN